MAGIRYTGAVYVATCLANGKCYIGKSIHGLAFRRMAHERLAGRGVFRHALAKHGISNFTWAELFLSDGEQALFEAERAAIASYRAAGVTLYNMSDGGEGPSGITRSDASRAKLSAARKGMVFSPGHRENISKSRESVVMPKWTPERRAKMEAAWERRRVAGLVPSEETRRRQSESAKARFQKPGSRAHLTEAGKLGAKARWGS